MQQSYPILSRAEAGPLIEAGKLRPAFLYEPQQAKGAQFVYVDLAPGLRRFYRRIEARK